jgi:hypothetical protein
MQKFCGEVFGRVPAVKYHGRKQATHLYDSKQVTLADRLAVSALEKPIIELRRSVQRAVKDAKGHQNPETSQWTAAQ